MNKDEKRIVDYLFAKLKNWIINEDCEDYDDALNEAEFIFLDYYDITTEEELDEEDVLLFEKWIDYCMKYIDDAIDNKNEDMISNDGIWRQSDYI